jgi:hypothetical protein
MNDIPKHFVKNNDFIGNCNFDLVKKQHDVYLYHRTTMEGKHFSYEVFISKFIAKGTPLPGGVFEKEDRMQYPGSAQFGKSAYECKDICQAEDRFDELLIKFKQKSDNKELSLKTGTVVKGRRGRKRHEFKFQLPSIDQTFTMNQLVASSGVSQPLLYIRVQELISLGRVKEYSRVRKEGQRGRATVVYQVIA